MIVTSHHPAEEDDLLEDDGDPNERDPLQEFIDEQRD